MAGALDRVYQELASEIRLLRPSCRSRAILPPEDLLAFLQRLSACRPEDRALVVVEAPELHCFLALQELPKVNAGQGTDGLGRLQLQVVEALCQKSFGTQAPPVDGCRKALRTIFLHYESNEVSVKNTVKLLSECAKEGWWDAAKLVVGRLCAHLKVVDLGLIEQKVLGTLRDSLVQYGVCCLVVLLEPLHKMIFLHLSSLMAQGSCPEVDTLPPAIKWYLRFLRKCGAKVVGNESQSTAKTITKLDIDYLFWPFIIPAKEIEGSFILPNQASSKEARDWISRYGMEIKIWQDKLIDLICSDLRMPKATGLQIEDDERSYNWLPFAEYALSPDNWIWLHDLLLHSKCSVTDIESRHKRFLETSATGAIGATTLGMAAVLVEILAQGMRTCKYCYVSKNLQQSLSDSNGRREDHEAECCGCIQQDEKCTGNAAALLIWMLRPDSLELCDSTWIIMFNNLLLAALTTREGFAIQYYDPSGEILSDRIGPGFSHEDKIPLEAIDSTLITLIENEKELLLNKRPKGAVQAFKQAERSKWRLERVVWPALLSQMSYCSYSFTCDRVLETLEVFGPRCSDIVDDLSEDKSPFPLLQLYMDQFLEVVKLESRFIFPFLRFLKAGSEIEAICSLRPVESEKSPTQESKFGQLDLCALQEDDFMAAIYHCVSQKSELWAQQLDILLLRVSAFSGGSFRCLVGECEVSLDTSKSTTVQESGTRSNARIFGKISARKKGDSNTAGLVAAIEGRRFLAWKLRKWTETLQGVSNVVAEVLPDLESLKRIYIWASALLTKFPHVDTWVGVGLSSLGQGLRAQEEDTLWKLEVSNDEADKGARSAKRPRLSSYSTGVVPAKILEAGRDHEWIVEALCRSSVSLEKYLLLYLNLDDTKRGRPKKGIATGRNQKTPSEAVFSHRKSLVSYLAKHPSQIPKLASLCRNIKVLQVACEAIQAAATSMSSTNDCSQSDVCELWFQFLEKFRETGGSTRGLTYLHEGSFLARMTECALRHTTLISIWPQDLRDKIVSVSPGMVCRVYEEARGHIESRLLAHDTPLKDFEEHSGSFSLSGVVRVTDLKPEVVAKYLETRLGGTYSNVGKASQPLQSSSLLDLLSMVFALCKPESRNTMLSHLQESDLYKKSTAEGFDYVYREQNEDQLVLLRPAFVLAVILWRSKDLKNLKNIYGKHRALTTTSQSADTAGSGQHLSFSEQRAAICHVLSTSEPHLCSSPLGDDRSAQPCGPNNSVSCEEMIFQLQAFAPVDENPRLYHAVNSWILLCCRMNIRSNLEHIRAFCRLHPCMVRDALVKRIEAEMMEASKAGGRWLGLKRLLEELKGGILQGLLAWLPLDARSYFTTSADGVPSEFWLGSDIKGVQEIVSCLRSTDVGVRRSAYCFVVAHQHHHHFVSCLILELCKNVAFSKPTREQEALLGVLMPVLMSEPDTASMIVDSVVVLFRKAKELVLSPGSGGEGKNVTSPLDPKLQNVKALLRVALLACEVSPSSFATEEIALLLVTLAKVEDPSEEIVVGAMQCLEVLALDLRVTITHVKLVQDLLLHLVYKPAGDYVWHLAMTFAEKFATGIVDGPSAQQETNPGVKEEKSAIECCFPTQELLYRCPLQRSIPLQAILKRFDRITSHQS